jgi:DNA-binding response OmpR family regulator
MRVTVNGAPVNLSPQEYRLLSYLMHHSGRVISQIELTEHLYAQDFERESNAIEVLVGRVRRKLGVDLIETRRGFGYTVHERKS